MGSKYIYIYIKELDHIFEDTYIRNAKYKLNCNSQETYEAIRRGSTNTAEGKET